MHIRASERLLGLLGYLAIFFLIPVNVKKDSMFVQFHARQGGVLFVLYLVVSLVLFIPLLFLNTIPIAGTIIIGLWFVVSFFYLLFTLIGIFKVLLGERYRMPVVADVALMLGL